MKRKQNTENNDVKQIRSSQKNFERKFTNYMKKAEDEKAQEELEQRRQTDKLVKQKMVESMKSSTSLELLRRLTISQ